MSIVDRTLPDGVEQVADRMYLVDPAELVFADGGFNPASDKLEYRNIRYALAEQKLVGAGLEKVKMERLGERIRTEGLLQEPICRWLNDAIQMVDGERRTRCLRKLIADNVQCWDSENQMFVPAKELYSKIAVKIYEMDDATALKINFSASESGEKFGEGALVAYVKHLRKCGQSDKEITDLTGYSIEWLRVTDKLCGLDEKSFRALSEGKITRELAGELLDIEDMALRLDELNQRIILAEKLHAEKTEDLTAKVAAAKETLDNKASEEKIAARQDDPEKASVTKAKRKKAEESVKSAEDKLQKHKDTTPKAGIKTDKEPKPLTFSKIEKHWLETIVATIKNDCKDEQDQPMEIDWEDVYLAKFLCEQIRKGQKDILRILKAHKKHKAERATAN